MKRRHFLQFATSTLATLGLSQLDIQQHSWRYAKVLAQNTPRKLALLVGINNYPDDPLKGCINDTYLQRELLIHRFGFNPKDILLVTDETPIKPTRAGILQAFEEHLIKQAKPGDVVVYHFSGHGSRVFDPDSGASDLLNSTFVPIDREISTSAEQTIVSDVMGETLFLLMSALQTENVAVVLDSCHSGGGKRGNLTIRAINGGAKVNPSPMERSYQEQWLSQMGKSREWLKQERQKSIAKGIVIASAARSQLAADTPFDGFHAGAFTYVLTQYLWQTTSDEPINSIIANVARSTTRISSTRQIPEFEVKKDSNNEKKPAYFLKHQLPSAEAVITKVSGKSVEFWLGGIEPQSIAAFNKNALFSIVDNQSKILGIVRLDSRNPNNGLVAQGTILETSQLKAIKPGLILQEQARAIPNNLSLRIGLDESLGTDKPTASQALSRLNRIEPTELGKKEVQYIFGRMTEANYQELQERKVADIPPVGSLGLYAPGLDLIPGSFGAAKENVTAGVERLKAKFRSLLAARLVKLTLNADSSKLKVSALMKVLDSQTGQPIDVAASAFTVRGSAINSPQLPNNFKPNSGEIQGVIPNLPLGTRVQFLVENKEEKDLYVTLLVITPEGEMVVLFPNSWTATSDAALIKAGERRQIPEVGKDSFKITVGKPLGNVEVLVIASASPLREALKKLQSIAVSRGERGGPLSLEDDASLVIDDLLGDLDRGTRGSRSLYASFDSTVRTVDTAQLAAMSISFRASSG
ncbi:caspase family protein [Aerosakkonemataceae cyanobacterium BLCC-F50]|uniref:Caspase family protein n=1 Tax=Floridaenema flaviceps BLCC-F50 TaxID=3153642 RepID=A0ABV4XQS0_9CYAN